MLQELDKGTAQKDLAEKYSIPKNIKSTWKKNRATTLACYEKGLDSKRIKPETQENIKKKAVNRRSKKSHSNVGVI